MPVKENRTEKILNLPRQRQLEWSRPLVMGILNVTPDSFSDGNCFYDKTEAKTHAQVLIEQGADIIDIGGESSRPGSDPVTADEELNRVIPVIASIRKFSDIPISIDTTKAEVADKAIKTGADMVNDISALRFDINMTDIIIKHDIPVILMHMLGRPKTMQEKPKYKDCPGEIYDFFSERIAFCRNKGIDIEKVILDPGIGFGKRPEDNLAILNGLDKFLDLGRPILIGASRKSFIESISGSNKPPDHRIGGSIAALLLAFENGGHIFRVHDVAESIEALKVYRAVTGVG